MDKQKVKEKMKKILSLVFATLFLTACSVKNPALDLGKRCIQKGDQIVYSYVWIYDKETGNKATKEMCDQIAE